MINGEKILRERYPEFDDECFQPGGLDLRLGKIEEFDVGNNKFYGIIDGLKVIPDRSELVMNALSVDGQIKNVYSLRPNVPYIATVQNKIKIDKNSLQFYKPRSSLLRCGTNVMTAIGDNGYFGSLSFFIMNYLPVDFVITRGERFAQLVDIRVDGAINEYDGDYQESE